MAESKDTFGAEQLEVLSRPVALRLRADPDGVDGRVVSVDEASEVGRRQARADVHVQHVVAVVHHRAHRVRAERARLVLKRTTTTVILAELVPDLGQGKRGRCNNILFMESSIYYYDTISG